jgi:hypothetical protein
MLLSYARLVRLGAWFSSIAVGRTSYGNLATTVRRVALVGQMP